MAHEEPFRIELKQIVNIITTNAINLGQPAIVDVPSFLALALCSLVLCTMLFVRIQFAGFKFEFPTAAEQLFRIISCILLIITGALVTLNLLCWRVINTDENNYVKVPRYFKDLDTKAQLIHTIAMVDDKSSTRWFDPLPQMWLSRCRRQLEGISEQGYPTFVGIRKPFRFDPLQTSLSCFRVVAQLASHAGERI